jgi:DNA polymerase-3 subunit gamma/tau
MDRWSLTYRPKKFSEVLGQESVIKFFNYILQRHAKEANELPVGFLFGGRSGVGKTTLARIVGASLNCHHKVGIEPCGECSMCQRIFSGQGGIREVDAAYFGLVDNIRKLREELDMYSVVDYQVVILDEVHMMSKESFNVLLKLLEEPPPSVLFILCTTEVHKVLETVRSRLVEFRFTAIPWGIIDAYLKKLLAKEGVECDPKIYHRLYKLSNDNLRDVIVSLEQLAQVGEGKITEEKVASVYGDVFIFEKVLDALWLGDYGSAVALYSQYSNYNTDFVEFLNGFLTIVGGYFTNALQSGSSKVAQYGKLLMTVYEFMQVTPNLRGEAAAKLMFQVIIDRLGVAEIMKEVLDVGVVSDEEALELLKG